MVQIEINNEYLELPSDLKLSLKQRNELLYEETLPLTYSLPFKLFLTPKNCEILNYPQEWKNRALFTGEMECLVYLFENDNPRKSLLNFKSCSDTEVECYIQVGKDLGNITDLSLNEIDMGTMQIVQDDDNPFFHEIMIELWIADYISPPDSFLFINFSININDIVYQFRVDKNNSEDFNDFRARAVSEFLSYLNATLVDITVSLHDTIDYDISLSLPQVFPDSKIYVFKLVAQKSRLYINIKTDYPPTESVIGSPDYKLWFITLCTGYVLDSINKWTESENNLKEDFLYVYGKIKDIHNDYIANNSEYHCLFPIVNNTKFVGEDPTDFVLFQNFGFNETYLDNKKLSFATPMPFLIYILKKTFKFLGYDAIGEFFENEVVKEIIIYSNVATSKTFNFEMLFPQLETYSISSTIVTYIQNKFNISAHAPNMSIKDFLIAVRTVFNLKFTYDYKSMKVNVEFVKDLQGFKIHQAPNLTEYFVNSWSMQFQKAQDKNVSIKSFEFDIDSNDNQNSFLLPYQQKLIIDENGKKEIKPKIGTIGEEVIESCMMPSVKIDGVYNGGGEPISQLKMLQVFGFRTDRNPAENNIKDQLYAMSQDRYAFFTRVSPLTISWFGDKGFYNQFWKNFTKLLVENKTLKIKTTFPPEQLSRMEENPFIFVNDSLLLFKEQDSEINANGTSTQNGTYVIV